METASPQPVVLIVDDDQALARLVEKTVRREGFSTAIALSGGEALAWLNGRRPDLMLLDLKLPDLHGRELLERQDATHGRVPFIIITGQGDERVAVDMMKRGALDYLLKDVHFLEFVPIVVRRAITQLDRERRLKAAEESLMKEHVFGNAVLAASGAMMIVCDREGRIVRSNRACERVTGYSHDELQGKPFWELFFSLPRRDAESAQAGAIGMPPDTPPVLQESSVLIKGGERRLISWSITTLIDDRVQAGFVIASGLDITEHKRLEQEILEISDSEQRRIGQDLHDGLGQEITAIALLNSTLQNSLRAKGLSEAATAERLAELLKHAGNEVRRISHGLQPVSADPESLMTGIRSLVANAGSLNGANCLFRCNGTVAVHNHDCANHLYRIAQEAIQNALRHGKPQEVVVSLARRDERVILEVQDDGGGFDPEVQAKSQGIGLSTMKYRAGAMNGFFEFARHPGGGVIVRCTVPDPQPVALK